MFQQSVLRTLVLIGTLAALACYAGFGGFFAREIVIEIAVLAILAIALDVVAGFGGLVSLCSGAIMGVAAYSYGALTVKMGLPVFSAAVLAVAAAAVFGFLVGWITGRISGIFFIMATLAFGQMVYTLVFLSTWLGGDDGMAGLQRFDLSFVGVDMSDSLQFAFFSLAALALVYAAAAWVMRSSFGRTLVGICHNETRMRAIGVNTVLHRACSMGFCALLSGVAGVLAAQHTQFISPDMLGWTYSGEVLIVVILGGLGTLVGPFVGAVVFVILKHQISDFTDHWHMFVGMVLIATVLAGRKGIYGQAERFVHLKARRAVVAEHA